MTDISFFDFLFYNIIVYLFIRGGLYIFMKQKYISPELGFIRVQTQDILTASDGDVFVDGEDLFD